MEPFSFDSPGYMALLESQSSQNVGHESIEVPPFSSQASGDPSGKQRKAWTQKEDLILISAWLNTSKDPIVGNEQKCGAFWKRIQDYFNASPQVDATSLRESSQCKQRWGRLNDYVCKFVGCYNAAVRQQSSGQNDNDVLKAASDIFHNDHGVKFTLEHAWRALRYEEKWISTCSSKATGQDKRKEFGESDVQEEVSSSRPPGVKACKAAKRKKTGKEADMEKMEHMLYKKENISKQNVLERLLAKSVPLSELEEALKMKLIADMLAEDNYVTQS